MAKKIFIDGKAGTTGLRIFERLENFKGIEIITLSEEKRKDLEKTVIKVNLEAAAEIAKQLRLRDISGIIIINN